ncbi:MAG: hypothetical protein Kow00133_16910 [Amphiplicatus sp.]
MGDAGEAARRHPEAEADGARKMLGVAFSHGLRMGLEQTHNHGRLSLELLNMSIDFLFFLSNPFKSIARLGNAP